MYGLTANRIKPYYGLVADDVLGYSYVTWIDCHGIHDKH